MLFGESDGHETKIKDRGNLTVFSENAASIDDNICHNVRSIGCWLNNNRPGPCYN